MTGTLSKTIYVLLAALFLVAGCGAGRRKDEAYEPLFDPNIVVQDYASAAIAATGGKRAWTNAKKLELDCVVTFYQPDGSFYLTEQHHEIHPWSNLIRMYAQEPTGKFVWQLSADTFNMLQAGKPVDPARVAGFYRDLAKAVLDLTTAPARFLDGGVVFAKGDAAVKIEGLSYYPIERRRSGIFAFAQPQSSRVFFYQNRDSSLVDIIWFSSERFLAVRGYDYCPIKKRGVSVPSKVEIFATNEHGVFLQRLVKLDYHSLKPTK